MRYFSRFSLGFALVWLPGSAVMSGLYINRGEYIWAYFWFILAMLNGSLIVFRRSYETQPLVA